MLNSWSEWSIFPHPHEEQGLRTEIRGTLNLGQRGKSGACIGLTHQGALRAKYAAMVHCKPERVSNDKGEEILKVKKKNPSRV